ncbi:hypothetical protein ACFYXQ_03630 [Nocardia jiangxiensis]|uniref:Immunity protein 50 n=1 Tax=Nocardia jiangxiensis TaxID=282685 RepID=A0ABW6RS88_9NOCA
MTRYEIGTWVCADLKIGDQLGDLEIRDIEEHATAERPGDHEDMVAITLTTTGGRIQAQDYFDPIEVPAIHHIEVVLEPSGLRIRFTCTARHNSPCRQICGRCSDFGELCGCNAHSTDSDLCQLTDQANHTDLEALLHAYDGHTGPHPRSGPVSLSPTPAGRFLWRYPVHRGYNLPGR